MPPFVQISQYILKLERICDISSKISPPFKEQSCWNNSAKKKAKQLSIPHLLRNQIPHSPVGAHAVPGVQAITARPQDMTKITEIMEIWLIN